jgi:hypothetical protein
VHEFAGDDGEMDCPSIGINQVRLDGRPAKPTGKFPFHRPDLA